MAFYEYRREEMQIFNKLRPVMKKKADDQSGEVDGKKDKHAKKTKVPPIESVEGEVIDADKAEFQRLNEIVRKGVEAFVEAGVALQKIHNGKLWKVGGFDSWREYCRSVAGMSHAHAHRLMQASECVIHFRETAEFSILPVAESQVRPLLRLKNPEDRASAWFCALENSDKDRIKQPTAKEVKQAVYYVLHDDHDAETARNPPTRSEQRNELVSKIRAAVAERHSWDDVEKLLADLEKLI